LLVWFNFAALVFVSVLMHQLSVWHQKWLLHVLCLWFVVDAEGPLCTEL
jgi:hypothetical protein